MTVRELAEWLSKFEDQEAQVYVVVCSQGWDYAIDSVAEVRFDPKKHTDYTDLRNNMFVRANSPNKNLRTLLLGDTGY